MSGPAGMLWSAMPFGRRIKRAIGATLAKHAVRLTSLDRARGTRLIEHYPAEDVGTHDCLPMPFVPMAEHLRRPRFTVPAGTSRLLQGVRYCAPNNMLLTRSRKIIAESSSTRRERGWFDGWHVIGRRTEHLGGYCTSIRSLHNNYYHSLVDNLPRLFLLHHPAYADREIKLLLPGGPTALEAYFLDRLSPPNVTVYPLDPEGIYSCDTFLFTSFLSRRFAGFLPPQYLAFFHRQTLPDRPRLRDKNIIISRRKAASGRGIVNEEELIDALAPLGFRPYVLEDLDLEAQIALFYDARVVVSPHGAGLTNLLFAKDASVVELHPNPQLFPHYYYLCRSLDHRYRYWCGNAETRFSPFRVDVPAVVKLVLEAEGA